MMKNILCTDRLTIRDFREGDFESAFHNYGKEQELGRFLPMFPIKNIEEMKNIIQGYMTSDSENSKTYAVALKETNEVIGQVILSIPYPELQVGEIAYLIGTRFQGKGYAKEAVRVVMEEVFHSDGIHLIEAKYNENNLPSAHLLQSLGFYIEATLRDRRIDRESGQRNNLVIASITKEELAVIS